MYLKKTVAIALCSLCLSSWSYDRLSYCKATLGPVLAQVLQSGKRLLQ